MNNDNNDIDLNVSIPSLDPILKKELTVEKADQQTVD